MNERSTSIALSLQSAEPSRRNVFSAPPHLRLDISRMLAPVCAEGGFSEDVWRKFVSEAPRLFGELREAREKGGLTFADLPYRRGIINNVRSALDAVPPVKDVLVLGMGGSSLGLRAIAGALAPIQSGLGKSSARTLHILDNVDPLTAQETIGKLTWPSTLVIAVSKSGTTAETLALLLRVQEETKRRKQILPSNQVIVMTDSEESDLALTAGQWGYGRLAVPHDVGGRFSVLTEAALFPAAVAGYPSDEIADGARAAAEALWSLPPGSNPALLLALALRNAAERGKNILVLMPYADRLVPLAHWHAQLWAESLGKKLNRRGKEVRAGSTPVVARGASDQHSQLQLYAEGPRDKAILFLRCRDFGERGQLVRAATALKAFAPLTGRTLAELFQAEAEATASSLAEAGCPSASLEIPALTPHALGALFYFFEFLTVAAAELWDVNAFDQPGVEAGKRAARALMEAAAKKSS